MPFATIDPATGKTLRTFQAIPDTAVEQKITRSADAFRTYKRASFAERSHWSITLAESLERDKQELGRLMTLEMGKTLVSAVQEVEKCAWLCRYFAANAERFLADENIQTYAGISLVRYEPLGVILAIMPWNFPFWQALRFGVPAILAGNVVLLKHAPGVPQCALKIEALFAESGFPSGVFQNLFVEVNQVPAIVGNPLVRAVSLTGSPEAGKHVAALAGGFTKKCVLELGGSDPFIVMPSADVSEAVSVGVTARTINNGQSCIAAKRFIIHASVYEEFLESFVDRMKLLRVGNPMDASTDIGPLARADLREKLHTQVQKSVQLGARLLLGGEMPEGPGFFYGPTVLADVPKNAPAYSEELFGPVASMFRVGNIDEAIRIANDNPLGLGSSVWTGDRNERTRFISELEAGAVFINSMVASDPRLPFGGTKNSGYGRELGPHGIREFTNVKTVSAKDR